MERTEVLDMMSGLKLYGMRSAYDETLATAIKRKHEPQRFVGDLLKAEISEKQARSIKYQLTVAKLPLAKDVDDFAFKNTPINEALVRDLAGRRLHRPAAQRRPGRGNRHGQDASGHRHRAKLHPRRIARALLHHRRSRQPARGSSPRRSPGTTCRLSHAPRLRHPRRTRLSPLRPGRRPIAVPPDQPSLRADLDHRHDQPRLRRMAERVRRSEDDDRAARPPHSPLRHRRDRQRKLALQKPRLIFKPSAPYAAAPAPAAQPEPAPPGRALPSVRDPSGVPIRCKSGVPFQCSLTRCSTGSRHCDIVETGQRKLALQNRA